MDHSITNPLTDFFADNSDSTESWPRYLIMSSSDDDKLFTSLSPFAIFKGIKGIAGDGVTIKRLFNGDVILTCKKKSQSENLLKCVLFGNVAPVTVTPHRSLNSSKGVIRNWELARTDPEEIKREIPIISEVKRISVKRNGVEMKTNTLILTFNVPKIPDCIRSGYLNIPVSQFVPNPLRCYKCQMFGHTTDKCKRAEVCAKCSEKGHNDKLCQKEYKCANCDGNHASFSKQCSFFKKEFDIQNIRVTKSVSFFEARKIYEQTHGQKVMNFAGAVKAPVQTTAAYTQTDVSWLGSEPIKRRQRSAVSVPNKPVIVASRSVGTTARASEIAKTVAPEKPSSPKQGVSASRSATNIAGQVKEPVQQKEGNKSKEKSKEKSKRSSPISVKRYSPQKLKETLVLNKEKLKRTYHVSDFLPDAKISPSTSDVKKTKIKKVDKNILYSTIHKYDGLRDCDDMDVTLTSASDLGKKPAARETLKTGVIKLPVD